MSAVAKRLGLLHLASECGEVERNRDVIERGTVVAAELGADWVVSGELVVCGYAFAPAVGTQWIERQPDDWMRRYARLAKHLDVTCFVNHPERVPESDGLYNSMFVIARTGRVIGKHRKICVTPGSEDWSVPGESAEPVLVDGVRVGLLVCADFHPPGPAARLKELGAEIIISSAAWHPGEWGPAGEWEARSEETQLPVVVCNRTGVDRDASFLEAESVLVDRGRRIATLRSSESAVFIVDLVIAPDETSMQLVGHRVISLGGG